MPSPIGHALGAVAVGWAVATPFEARRSLALQVGILAALGAAPDLDFLIGRHSRETHSLGAAVIAASLAAWWRWPIAATPVRAWLAAFAAWFSHPILDSLSPDTSIPIGVMMFWPFSTVHWLSGIAVFDGIWRGWRPPMLIHNLGAVGKELATLVPAAALVWWLRSGRR